MDMLSLNKQALAKLTEGVVLLDDKGRPLSATRNSQPWLRHCIEIAPALADMIAAAKAGALALPAAVDLRMQGEDEQDVPEEAWLVANGGAGYALLIRPRLPSESDASAGEGRFLALLGMGVRQEVAQLGAMLREHGQTQIDAEPILRRATNLDTLLGEIGELAELHQRDEVFFEERLALPALLRDIMLELRQQRIEGGASHVLECGEAPPPGPVYGNAHWLKKALHTLLAGIEQSGPPFSSIRIHLRQLGDFIVLSAGAGNGGGAPAGQESGARPLAAPSVQALRMRICQRVIKLHGGQLKLRLPERAPERAEGQAEAAIESFTLTLPTGVPAQDRGRLSCADCRINVQAMQYARDLAKVMQPQPLTKARLTNAHPSNAHPTN